MDLKSTRAKRDSGLFRKELLMLQPAEIQYFIDLDKTSKKKQMAKIGSRYYEGDHDIKDYKLFYYDKDGELQQDKTRSNIKISHPFFTELVDQEVQYLLSSKDGYVFSNDPTLQKALDEYFNNNEDFEVELNDLITGAIARGFDYLYAYKNKNGKTSFQYADSLGVVEVRAKDASDNCDYIINWYIDRFNERNEPIYKIEAWDSEQCYFYKKIGSGSIFFDDEEELNPRPHILYEKDENGDQVYESYGRIPFFRLDNNRKQFSGLKPIKELIDDYDLMSCGLSNNLQDANEYLVVVSGFQGDNFDELQRNLKTKKIVGVDENGSVDYKTVSIPYEARKAKLELDKENIYRFGMGFNASQVGDGNVTNVVIKSRYSLLDLKVNKLEKYVKKLMRSIVGVVLKEINAELETQYTQKDVNIVFEREIMTNATDNAQIKLLNAQERQTELQSILNAAMYLGDDETRKLICEVLDIDLEELESDDDYILKLLKGAEDELQAEEV